MGSYYYHKAPAKNSLLTVLKWLNTFPLHLKSLKKSRNWTLWFDSTLSFKNMLKLQEEKWLQCKISIYVGLSCERKRSRVGLEHLEVLTFVATETSSKLHNPAKRTQYFGLKFGNVIHFYIWFVLQPLKAS